MFLNILYFLVLWHNSGEKARGKPSGFPLRLSKNDEVLERRGGSARGEMRSISPLAIGGTKVPTGELEGVRQHPS
jgi:hypothetical protein